MELDKLVEMAESVKHEAVKMFRSKDWHKLNLLQQKLWRMRCLQTAMEKLKTKIDSEVAKLAKEDGWT